MAGHDLSRYALHGGLQRSGGPQILSFGVSNYLMGLPLKDAGTMIQMPVNIKLLLVYTVIIYALGLVLKQGMYLFLQNSLHKANSANSLSEKTLIVTAAMFFAGI